MKPTYKRPQTSSVHVAENPIAAVLHDTFDANNAFAPLGVGVELQRAVQILGYTQPTTVQTKVIPLALHPLEGKNFHDLAVSSQTGSGKTAAFLLPVLQRIFTLQQENVRKEREYWENKINRAITDGEMPPVRPKRKNPRDSRSFKAATPLALVLCPTRELAQQVAQDAIDLVSQMSGLRVATVIGGLPYRQQIERLQNANLVVATPGRLLDLESSGQIKLDQVQCLVVDEADRMLDLGFAEDLAAIHDLTDNREQTLMFSATFAPRIMTLASRVMRDVQRIEIDSGQTQQKNIEQILFWADNLAHKR